MKSDNPLHWSNIDHKHRKLIMAGLMLGMLAACLDGTIVSTCGTIIAEDLGGLGLYAWMFTAFMLAETITIPIGGKLSDLYGRKPFFLLGMGLFAGGSVIAGLSVNMEMFIICRAIQGVGGGFLMPVATAAIADLYSPTERGKMQGIMGAIFGLGTALGPVIGGFIADSISWHWVFYINIPLAAVALFLCARKFPSLEVSNTKRIDFLGMSVLGLFLLDLLLFFTWAGKDFDWISYESGIMVGVAAMLLIVFVFLEFRAEDPVIAPRLFKNRTFVGGAFSMMIFGLALTGSMTYMSMFSIFVMGLSVREAGYLTIALVAGLMITASMSGKFVEKTGSRPWLIAGPIISFAGMVLMSTLGLGDSVWLLALYMFILGIGLGCVMAVLMVAVQNSAKADEMGMTTSSVNLFRAIGATVATGVFAFIINLRLDDELAAELPAEVYAILPHDTDVLGYIAFMPQYATQILNSFADSVDFAFLLGGIIILLMLVAVPFVKNHNSTDDMEEAKEIKVEDES
ncbi:MAG: putative transporter [Methanomassiliicoccales archaeon PtaU1.Bin124]|nr:MAG: putative transporter [Methanomassiliicoccales archaeon PtaU1.Bin124]